MRATGPICLLFVVLLAVSVQGIWKGFGLGLISMLKSQFGDDVDNTYSGEDFENFMSAIHDAYKALEGDPQLLLNAAMTFSEVLEGKKDMQSTLVKFLRGRDGQKLQKIFRNIFERSGQQDFADRLLQIGLKAYSGDDSDWMKDIHELGIGLKTFLLQALDYLERKIRQSQRSYEF
ncbi:hypothetical protein AAHC03_09998 [Spirometra sp. Aus1]